MRVLKFGAMFFLVAVLAVFPAGATGSSSDDEGGIAAMVLVWIDDLRESFLLVVGGPSGDSATSGESSEDDPDGEKLPLIDPHG